MKRYKSLKKKKKKKKIEQNNNRKYVKTSFLSTNTLRVLLIGFTV